MAVNTTSWNATFTGDGTTTTFLCAFPLMETEDLKVYVDDVLQTENREYTLTDVTYTDVHTVNPNYSVVFTDAPASGTEVYIRRQTPRWNSNTTSFGDVFSLPVFENNYDNLVMMFQEIGGLILEGFQGPAPEIAPNVDYEPQSSGFFPAKIISGPVSGIYTLRAVIAMDGGGWSTTALPVLTEEGAEINRRSDMTAGDIVLVLPIADSSGEEAWRFVGNQSCSDVSTPYAGPWYDIVRCDNTGVEEVAWVRGDEFSSGDSFMLNGVCYRVEATSPAVDPGPELVIRLADTTSYASCAACLGDQDPDDPNANDPPVEASRFRNMESCLTGTRTDFSIPIEYFGIPTNHDLTKVYEVPFGVDTACFFVSEEETATPDNELLPTHQADLSDECNVCGCTDSGTGCGGCTDSGGFTPLEYTVTFSGVNLCFPYCDSIDLYDWAAGESDATLNTTHVLTQTSSCGWSKTLTSAIAYIENSDACGGTLSTELLDNVTISLYRIGSTWTLSVEATWFSNAFISYFYDEQNETGAGVCSTMPVFTNDNTTCAHPAGAGPGNAGDHGTGGIATVVCS